MEAIVIIFTLYLVLYCYFMTRLVVSYQKVPQFQPSGKAPHIKFSIIIPFRNEAKNLNPLLESIARIDYPPELFELILVNDGSTDDSERIVYQWRVAHSHIHTTMIDNVVISGSPKKDALTRAVPIVANEWIVTTDADCFLPESWLKTLNDFILSENVEMIAAPVMYRPKNSFLAGYQQTELLNLQAATIAGFGMGNPFMCNGANFAYTKKFFHSLNGFGGSTDKASGDDVFLLQKAAAQHPEKVKYLLSRAAMVLTNPESNISRLFNQRVRWASKAKSYIDDFAETLALVVLLGNCSLLVFTLMTATGILGWEFTAAAFLLKFSFDYALLLRANRFFRNGKFIFPILPAIIYPFFSTFVGIFALFGKYRWKGRTLR